MASNNKKEIIRGTGTLTGDKNQRKARFQVTKTSMYVDALSEPVGVAYSNASITDSDAFPDGDYEFVFLDQKLLLTRKNGHYLARR
jgi:hypothetical protein